MAFPVRSYGYGEPDAGAPDETDGREPETPPTVMLAELADAGTRRDLIALYEARTAATGVDLGPLRESWGVAPPGAGGANSARGPRHAVAGEPVPFGRGTTDHAVAASSRALTACRRRRAGLPGRFATLRPRPFALARRRRTAGPGETLPPDHPPASAPDDGDQPGAPSGHPSPDPEA